MTSNNGDGVIFPVSIITSLTLVVTAPVFIMASHRVWLFHMVDNWDRRVLE